MYLKFLKLEVKSFLRSKSFATSVGMKILMIFLVLYLLFILLGMGFGGYELAKEYLHVDPFRFLCGIMIYVWVYDLVFRFLMQQLSTQNIKPFLTLNIPKAKVVKYTLLKTVVSPFNWVYAFFYIPFLIRVVTDSDYNHGYLFAFGFLVVIIALYFFNNFLNIILNGKDKFVYGLAILFAIFAALDYYKILPLREVSERIFMSFREQPFYVLIPIALLIIGIYFAYKTVKQSFYLDEGLASKERIGKNYSIAYLNKYGVLGTFINNDLRLLTRSKMGKGVLISAVLFLFYGLLFLSSKVYQGSTMMIFLGIFTTGGFQFMFGQRIPSFDSSYYPLMMTLDVPYKEYLRGKWWLMNIVTVAATIVCVFYVYFGWDLYLSMVAGGIYNVGVNSQMVLLGGAFNKSPVDLNAKTKAFAQKNNFNIKALLLIIPQMVIPMLIFGGVHYFFGMAAAIGAIAVLGIIGFLLRERIFNIIVGIYKKQKYSTLIAFKEV